MINTFVQPLDSHSTSEVADLVVPIRYRVALDSWFIGSRVDNRHSSIGAEVASVAFVEVHPCSADNDFHQVYH